VVTGRAPDQLSFVVLAQCSHRRKTGRHMQEKQWIDSSRRDSFFQTITSYEQTQTHQYLSDERFKLLTCVCHGPLLSFLSIANERRLELRR
jgi:hypothetical protein